MSEQSQEILAAPQYRRWLQWPLVLLASLLIVRFVLEVAGVSHSATRLLSDSAGVFLTAIYLGAVAPLFGVKKGWQLVIPGTVMVAWTEIWIILATLVSAIFSLRATHFAEPADFGNWPHLLRHIAGHAIEIIPFSIISIVLMATVFALWRWPVTVGPGAVIGGLVILRYTAEAMGASSTTASAWSSTVGALLVALYLGGVGARWGFHSFKAYLVPSLVLGWVWRFWIFLAALTSAAIPFYKTHFFNPAGGHLPARLGKFFLLEFIVVGFFAGLLIWGIASWTARVARPLQEG